MISQALELRVEDWRVSHSSCMYVVCHDNSGLGVAGKEVVTGMQAGQSQGGLSHVGKCRSTSRVRGEYTDDTRHFTAFQVRSSG